MKYFTITAVFVCLGTVGALLTLTLNEATRYETVAETTVSESELIRLEYEEIDSDYAAQEPAPLAARIIIEEEPPLTLTDLMPAELSAASVLNEVLPTAKPFPAELFTEPTPTAAELAPAVLFSEPELSLFDSAELTRGIPLSYDLHSGVQQVSAQKGNAEPLPPDLLLPEGDSTPVASPEVESGEVAGANEKESPWAKYPIWLLIEQDGVQFLQTPDEVARHQQSIPPEAFLVGCVTSEFQATSGDNQAVFRLTCEDFVLMGRYGTNEDLEVKGAKLSYTSKSQQVELGGNEKLPLECRQNRPTSETLLRAEAITLSLVSGESYRFSAINVELIETDLAPTEQPSTNLNQTPTSSNPFHWYPATPNDNSIFR